MVPWWPLVVGLLFVSMALAGPSLSRWPVSTAMIYLGVGYLLGPAGVDLLAIDGVQHHGVVEILAEVAVLVSLFAVGLKLGKQTSPRVWATPLRLAGPGMLISIALFALLGVFVLGLAWPAAVLLGALLAPTDPVLASEVQVRSVEDRDAVRYSLSAEGAINDGMAFPFVMLGLGLLGLHALGPFAWRWVAVDLLWATAAGIAIGAAIGLLARRLLVRMGPHSVVFEDFIVIGLVAFAYGLALLAHAYGFLAVFAAGLTLRHDLIGSAARDIGSRLSAFTAQIERLSEVVVVLVTGALLGQVHWTAGLGIVVAAALVVVRPVAVLASVSARALSRNQRRLIAWFGIRGAGSLYYLGFAASHGIEPALTRTLLDVTVAVVAASILVHGLSATPVMEWYDRRRRRRRA